MNHGFDERRALEIAKQLGGRRAAQHQRASRHRIRHVGENEDRRRPDGEPRIAEEAEQADRAQLAAYDLGELGDHESADHCHRRDRRGNGEEQRDEGQLHRHGPAAARVEFRPQATTRATRHATAAEGCAMTVTLGGEM